ncbi:hypothetical protein [Mucilaginibacter sp. SP1R1]|uniref:hypothetical protein n=1 Tax=Mucilaginibacter sp. SP1R1 TaxID=2723091 RepID=UPI00160C5F01|nr:hypothetical protein [Mucilaginibacter sp. SP1R1]MBB6149927.1 hypothetical protein [Mucilaginibacter sp. SP1R1]
MLLRLFKSALVIAFVFALQISVKAEANAGAVNHLQKDAGKTGLKKSNQPYNLYAEAGTSLHLSALKSHAPAADIFLATDNASLFKTSTRLYTGRSFYLPSLQFYRLILFPFHGFW